MADISKIKLADGTYDIKDETARTSVATLAGTISGMDDKINAVANGSNRKYVFIGDSYNTTDTPSGGVQLTPWGTLLASYLNITSGDYYNAGVSGAGWSRDTASTFLQELQSLNIQNKGNITDIVVCGGINDNNQTDSQVLSAVEAFSQHVAQYYPNAKIHAGLLGWSTNAGMRGYLEHASELYTQFAQFKNVDVIEGSVGWLHNYDWIQPDGNHPYLNGSKNIARNLANFLKGGETQNCLEEDLTVTAVNTALISTTGTLFNIHQALQGSTLNLQTDFVVNYATLTVKSDITSINLQETNGRYAKQIGTISGSRLFDNLDTTKNPIQTGIASIMLSDNTYVPTCIPYAVEVYRNNVYLELFGQITISNPKYIILKPMQNNLTVAVTKL